MQTSNLNLSLLSLNQSKKEITVNEALIIIDAMINTCLIDIGVDKLSENPQNGDLYAISNNPEDEWKNNANKLAFWHINNWYYITPKLGLTMWVKNKNKLYTYNGERWFVTK